MKKSSNQNVAFIWIAFAVIGLFAIALVSKSTIQTPLVAPAAPQSPLQTPVPIATPEPISSRIKGRIHSVTDGDTVFFVPADGSEWMKVRLAGIDAPELGQDFSKKAKDYLSGLVLNKDVSIEGDKIDKYRRRVAKIYVGDTDVNLEMVKAGFAWHFKKYESEQTENDQQLYADAEYKARLLSTGLWGQENPIAPWDYRAGKTVDPALKDKIFGNTASMVYHWAGCPGFAKISAKNRTVFDSWEEAEEAGYTAATNCSKAKPESQSAAVTADEFNGTPPPIKWDAIEAQTSTPSQPTVKPVPTPKTYSTPSTLYSESSPQLPTSTPNYDYYRTYPATPAYSPPRTRSVTPIDDGRLKTVHVDGYYKKNGTYVEPYMRRPPRRH